MSLSPAEFAVELKLLQYSQSFHDFPKNFKPPSVGNPNYVPPYNAGGLLIFSIAAAALMIAAVALRLYVRASVQKKFGVDDWLIIPSLVLSLGYCSLNILIIMKYGVGKHVYDIPPSALLQAEASKFAGILLYYTSVYFTKMSIVAFIYRLVERTAGKTRLALHATSVMYTLMYLSSVLTYGFSCRPLRATWDLLTRIEPTTQCLDIHGFIYLMGIFYAVGDFWLLLLPIPKIWSLSLPLRSKIGMIVVMSLGLAACVGSVIKLVYIGGLYNSWDPTWNSVPSLWGASVEVSVGIICACLPSFSVLIVGSVKRSLQKIVSSSMSNSKRRTPEIVGGSGIGQKKVSPATPKKSQLSNTFDQWDIGSNTMMSSFIDPEKAPEVHISGKDSRDSPTSSTRSGQGNVVFASPKAQRDQPGLAL